MGMEGVGQAMGQAIISAILIAFLAGAGCAGCGYLAWKYRPFNVKVESR